MGLGNLTIWERISYRNTARLGDHTHISDQMDFKRQSDKWVLAPSLKDTSVDKYAEAIMHIMQTALTHDSNSRRETGICIEVFFPVCRSRPKRRMWTCSYVIPKCRKFIVPCTTLSTAKATKECSEVLCTSSQCIYSSCHLESKNWRCIFSRNVRSYLNNACRYGSSHRQERKSLTYRNSFSQHLPYVPCK